MTQLSERQEQLLQGIEDFIEEHGYSPTVRELCDRCGLRSPSNVSYHLKILEAHGWLTRQPGSPRSIVLKRKEKEERS